jgi:hypothetical protein
MPAPGAKKRETKSTPSLPGAVTMTARSRRRSPAKSGLSAATSAVRS